MSKIIVYSNWCYFDRIEGDDTNLETGDILALYWPNGVRQVVEITVKSWTESGHDGVRVKHAFAETIAQGAIVTVRLQPIPGLEAERLPKNTPTTKLGELL